MMKWMLSIPLLLLPLACPAATIHVPADQPTIQAGIDASVPGDTVLIAAGTFTGDGNRDLSFDGKDIVVMGAGPELTILDLEGTDQDPHRGVAFLAGETNAAVLRDLTIRNGRDRYNHGVGLSIDSASPSIINVHLVSHHTDEYYTGGGAGIHCRDGSPVLESVLIQSCSHRGSVFVNSTLQMRDVTVRNCYSGEWSPAGGMLLGNCEGLLENVVFDGNSVFNGGKGGGAYVSGPAAPDFQNCVFINNYAHDELFSEGRGGGLYVHGVSPRIIGTRFENNWGVESAALHILEGQPEIVSCLFIGNNGPLCSGVYLENTAATLRNLTFHENGGGDLYGEYAWGDGHSLICDDSGETTIENCIFAHNTQGTGIHLAGGPVPTVACCAFFENEGGHYGGAMPDIIDVDGNFEHDPLYCGDNSPDAPLSPASCSPCAPDNNECGELIGAFEVGCDNEAYFIAGRVTDPAGTPMPDVQLLGLDYPVCTDADGEFLIWRLAGWNGRLEPFLPGYGFTPPLIEFTDLDRDHPGQDFVGERRTLIRVPGDYPDLAGAFDIAVTGDTLLVAPGTYSGPENRNLDFAGRDLVVMSEAGSEQTIIDCGNADLGFFSYSAVGSDGLLQGFTIRRGHSGYGGCLSFEHGDPTFRDIRCEDSWAYMGGGIFLGNSNATLERVVVCRCTSDSWGAGLFMGGEGTPVLNEVTIHGNASGDLGGGIHCRDGSAPLIENSIISGNMANDGGGVFCFDGNSIAELSCSDLFGNTDLAGSPNDYGGFIADQTGQNGNISADPLFCDPDEADFTLANISPCLPENNDCGVLMGAFGQGCVVSAVAGDPVPTRFALGQNHPNPFNPTTTIEFDLPRPCDVTITVYDVGGRRVATLVDGVGFIAGRHAVTWNASSVASGVYHYRIDAGDFTATNRMILLK